MIEIRKADVKDALIIHQLVHQIYLPTYKDILSQGQIDFMLEKSYTEASLVTAMKSSQDFFILYENNVSLGFMALSDKTDDILRIEKLYLLPNTQGMGLGRFFVDFAAQEAVKKNKKALELNVNRSNKAYFFYLKVGFVVVEEVDIPYYGYILDDYVMQKQLL